MRNSITLRRVRVREICQTFGMFVNLYHGKGKESKQRCREHEMVKHRDIHCCKGNGASRGRREGGRNTRNGEERQQNSRIGVSFSYFSGARPRKSQGNYHSLYSMMSWNNSLQESPHPSGLITSPEISKMVATPTLSQIR